MKRRGPFGPPRRGGGALASVRNTAHSDVVGSHATADRRASAARIVDARGSLCPGPLMELIAALRAAEVGCVVTVWSSDRGSRVDIPRWVDRAGHLLISQDHVAEHDEFVVQKLH